MAVLTRFVVEEIREAVKNYLGKCSNNQNGNLRWHLP